MKKSITLIIFILTLVFCVAGCGNDVNNANNSSYSADSAPKTDEAYSINTSAGDFYFPVKWKNDAEAKTDDDGLKMYYKDTLLFELSFTDNQGTNIGRYNGKDIYVSSFEVAKDNMTDSEYNTALAIQDDINFMLKKLEESSDFQKITN